MRHEVLVFDFDGTLVDSNQIKSDGFGYAFADCAECVSKIPQVLAKLKGRTRYEIVGALADSIDGLSGPERGSEVARRLESYSTWVEDRIVETARLSPAGELLERWHAHASLYICSLTPSRYLMAIVDRIGWRRFFLDVAGHPLEKGKMLATVVARHGVEPKNVLMVGDSDEDEGAAAEARTAFFRIRRTSDLLDLDRYLTT